jgi:hypothetical protein
MSETDADFVTILSSELIATIVEQYFNDVMYKVAVKVVDLKPTSDGYAFSLAFVTIEQQLTVQKVKNGVAIAAIEDFYENGIALDWQKRDEKGRFVSMKHEKEDDNG